jgi:hypothetical protein
MRCPILLPFALLVVAMPACVARCQIPSATEAAARDLVEVMVREGGREAAAELAEMGGEAAVRGLLKRVASEGGEELVERVAKYGTRYGPEALKAVERSPGRMIRALDGMPPSLVAPAVRAAAREPELTARLVGEYGVDALEVAAKHPGVGAGLAEKLGADGITIGQKLSTDQAVAFARYADDIAARPPGERNELLDAMVKAPSKVLDYLENHPRVLLTTGGVAAIIAAKDNLLGSPIPSGDHDAPPPGLIERIVLRGLEKFTVPIVATGVILAGGIVCCVLIRLPGWWKLKALRLECQGTKRPLADSSRRRSAIHDRGMR